MYHYGGNNPIRYIDPDGRVFCFVTGGIGAGIGLIYGAYKVYKDYEENHSIDWKSALLEIGKDTLIGGAIGFGGGAAISFVATGSAFSSTLAVYVGAHLKLAALGAAGFETFQKFKESVGRAGDGKAWHHIVEQTTNNISRFGTKAIHNYHNIVKISHGADTLHSKVSGYYSSIQSFTNGQTVRQWLSTQSYEDQWKFGLQVLTEFAKEIGAKIEFIE